MKIYVAMHKELNMIMPDIYEKILVGSFDKNTTDILRDDIGDNISKKNENYCELTAVYWIWKNSNENIVGLCHYRRFFINKWYYNINKILTEKQIREYLEENDIILPKKNYYKGSIEHNIYFAPNKQDMTILRQVLINTYPEYEKDYDLFMKNNCAYLYNMIITKKEIFDEYCEWLFKILFETEKNISPETYIYDSYRKRMFGFLSERLLNVWIIHNKKRFKIKELDVLRTDDTFFIKVKRKIGNMLRSRY